MRCRDPRTARILSPQFSSCNRLVTGVRESSACFMRSRSAGVLARRTLSVELNVTCRVEVPLQGTRTGRRHPGAARRLPRAMVNRPVGPTFHKLPSGLRRIGARVFQPVSRTGMSVLLSFGHVILACDAGHAASKPRRGGLILAQGKRSAALGRDANIPWPEGPLQRVQTLNDQSINPSILPLQIMLIMLIMSKKRIPPFHQKRMICAHPLSPTDYISSPFALESWTLSVTIDTGVLKPEIKRPLCLGGFV